MTTPPILYATTYPGAAIIVATLGAVEIGRIMDEGRRASWCCHLPPYWRTMWQQANDLDDAKSRLEDSVAQWLRDAGLTAREACE